VAQKQMPFGCAGKRMKYLLEKNTLSPSVFFTDNLKGVVDNFDREDVQAIILQRDLGEKFNRAAKSNSLLLLKQLKKASRIYETDPDWKSVLKMKLNPVVRQMLTDLPVLNDLFEEVCQQNSDLPTEPYEFRIENPQEEKVPFFHMDNDLTMVVQYMGRGTLYIPGIVRQEHLKLAVDDLEAETFTDHYNVQSLQPGHVMLIKGHKDKDEIYAGKRNQFLVHAAPPEIPGLFRFCVVKNIDSSTLE
jgi:hypothetical protein